MQQYGDLTGTVPPNLGEADTAMRDTAQALAAGRDAQAALNAQKAIEALQKGGQSMRQQLARQFGRSQSQADSGDEPGDEPGEDGQMGEGANDGQGTGENGTADGGPGNQPGDSRNGPGRNGRSRRLDRLGQERDPLGRMRGTGNGGTTESDSTEVPEQMEQARTRALQEELRRRDADRTRRQEELDYIERLLKQF